MVPKSQGDGNRKHKVYGFVELEIADDPITGTFRVPAVYGQEGDIDLKSCERFFKP